jgi:hypothetical protein
MRKRLLKVAIAIFAINLVIANGNASASRNFVEISLPNSVSIEIPRNWLLLSGNQRITLDTAVESKLDLSGIEYDISTLPFAANLYDDGGNTIGMVNVRYYPKLDLTQSDVNASTAEDLIALDDLLKKQMLDSVRATEIKVTSWNGTQLKGINGITAFITEYRRTALDGVGQFKVRLVRVYAGDQSFTLTVSYRESAETLLGPITDRIISSLSWTK